MAPGANLFGGGAVGPQLLADNVVDPVGHGFQILRNRGKGLQPLNRRSSM